MRGLVRRFAVAAAVCYAVTLGLAVAAIWVADVDLSQRLGSTAAAVGLSAFALTLAAILVAI